MQQLRLQPIRKVQGEINLPGSKSLSNRALLLAALSKGTTHLTNLLDSDDVAHMLSALQKLGVKVSLSAQKTQCTIIGLGRAFNTQEMGELTLFLGNAGTAMRPLCAALCLGQGDYVLTGEARMFERPIGSLVDALRDAGAKVSYLGTENYPPLRIQGQGLKGGNIKIDGSVSSQFLTAFLMSAPMASADTRIEIIGELVSKPYIKITLKIMKDFGVEVEHDNYQTFIVKGKQTYTAPGDYLVEGDASSASYFLAAGAIAGGSITVTGVGKKSIQGDIAFADALQAMGAKIEWGDDYIKASKGPLKAIDMDFNHIPDAAMTLAMVALFAKGTTHIRNIYNWRVKETDRLYAMAKELRKVGAEVVEGKDYISITPPKVFKDACIDTYDDHRIAMCFSLVALAKTGVSINDPQCTSKTFPDFFNKFSSVSCY
ncbi:3-phosphoshikimate 1-carboxyvinyltransferase [Psychromonas sp. CNPT3]|uniref:3-phosphoshikimate 1-carboxyvinyltransferase n=1 Tax=Psychromonas sp. CNPT3 TaxID=314282 RepID=UPI00006E76AB|nr:3-phosphoshikimate 1-carboxyvinyltransferase [Psychromonas sp. CNPT3]AGH80611.1 3-phosphoshikimate 1-carboxyvinyltransferase [Psychromonas sp. CNPT3]